MRSLTLIAKERAELMAKVAILKDNHWKISDVDFCEQLAKEWRKYLPKAIQGIANNGYGGTRDSGEL